MKKNKQILFILIFSLMAFMLSSCTRTGAASSWPGLSVEDDRGYVSFGNQTYAVDLNNGSLLWKYPSEADRNRQAYSAPLQTGELVVFGDYVGNLVAVNADNGIKKWEYSGGDDRYIASAAMFEGLIYAPNTDGYIYAVDMDGNLQWKFLTAGPNWTRPVADESNVYFASMDHFVYAIPHAFDTSALTIADDGSKTLRTDTLWTSDLEMAVVAAPVLDNGMIFVATIEGKLFAVDAATGNVKWSFNNGGDLGAIWGAPVVSDSVVFFADIEGDVYTVEKETGKPRWPSPFSAGGKIVGGGLLTEDGVVYATDEGKLFLINDQKEVKTIMNFENAIYAPSAISDGNIIVAPASEEGLLQAIDPEGFKTWSFAPSE